MTAPQINSQVTALNAVIALHETLSHVNWAYNRESDRRLTSDHAANSASAAFSAFVVLMEASGWRKFGNEHLGYIHDTDGRIEMRNIFLKDAKYGILQHAYVSYFPDYRDPIIPLTEEPEEA